MDNKSYRPIVVSYLGVKSVPKEMLPQYYETVTANMDREDVICYIIPSFNTDETDIKCINPVIVGEKEYEEAMRKLDELKIIIEKNIKEWSRKD